MSKVKAITAAITTTCVIASAGAMANPGLKTGNVGMVADDFTNSVTVFDVDTDTVLGYFLSAYDTIRRPVGHTPFHSVAVLAMIRSVVDGTPVEVRAFHELILGVKKASVLEDHIYFASGNSVDKMFVLIRPDFAHEFRRLGPKILESSRSESGPETTGGGS